METHNANTAPNHTTPLTDVDNKDQSRAMHVGSQDKKLNIVTLMTMSKYCV